jgi:hypothetical protein
MPKINWQTVTITGICIAAGAALVAMGHHEYGGMLITFAVGGALLKPAVSQ